MDSRHEREKDGLQEGNDYLWDGSGKPDAEVEKLETLLGKFRQDRPGHDRPVPVFPEIVPETPWASFTRRTWLFPAVSAAVVVIAAAIVLSSGKKEAPVIAVGWDVSEIEGTPQIGTGTTIGKTARRLGIGQVLETDHASRAELQADDVGRIEVDADTRLRLLSMGNESKRIALDHGTIHAYIWATPGQFVVDTPSATTVDLGCAYTLTVDDSGVGMVRTSIGWVGFKLNGHEAFIPAGAACSTKPKVGPGTPYFEDASQNFKAALARFDFEDSTGPQRASDLAVVLRESRQRDGLTLWHLLSRVEPSQRGMVFTRLSKFVPPPAGVTRDGILRLDREMLDRWWNRLGFDDISVWRHWERSWSGTTSPTGTR
jgi:hypothetical protein